MFDVRMETLGSHPVIGESIVSMLLGLATRGPVTSAFEATVMFDGSAPAFVASAVVTNLTPVVLDETVLPDGTVTPASRLRTRLVALLADGSRVSPVIPTNKSSEAPLAVSGYCEEYIACATCHSSSNWSA